MMEIIAMATATESDPITAIITRDWAALGGWSLLFGSWFIFLLGVFREWWVPGPTHRRLAESAKENSTTLATTAEALKQQVIANEITKHFFEETAPRRIRETEES